MGGVGMNIRPATPDELRFVVSSWASSFRDYVRHSHAPNAYGAGLTKLSHGALVRAGVERMVEWPDVCVDVIDIEGTVVCWACFERSRDSGVLLHYVYTRAGSDADDTFRGKGLATELVADICRRHPGRLYATMLTGSGGKWLDGFRRRSAAA